MAAAVAYTDRGHRVRIISAMLALQALRKLCTEGIETMAHRHRAVKLIPAPPLTQAQSAALMRRLAKAKARAAGADDPAIPRTLPAGARVIHGPARRGRHGRRQKERSW